MKVVVVTYKHVADYDDADQWLDRIVSFTAIPGAMAQWCDVTSIHNINFSGCVKKNEVDYYFIKQSSLFEYFPYKINRLIQKLDPNIILVQGFSSPLQILFLKNLVSRSKIVVQHRSEKVGSGIKRSLQKLADKYISAYLFSSVEMATPWLENEIISERSKVYELPGSSSIFTTLDKSSARNKLGISGKTFLWIGRLDKNKDPVTVVKAFAKYVESNSSSRLYMIYQNFDLLDQVKETIRILGLAKNIVLVGKVAHAELGLWFSACDYIICSSHYEGSNTAVLEAMSCGCIPIVTDIPSFKLHTNNGRVGYSFKAGNVDELANVLKATDKANLENDRSKVLDYFEHNLSLTVLSKKMYQIFQEV